MSETPKTAEPSDPALNAAASGYNNIEKLRRAYAIDVAPLIAERDALKKDRDEWKHSASGLCEQARRDEADLARLTRENAAMREALAFCREHTASCSLHLSRDDDLDHPSLRSTMATHLWQSHVKANAALAQLTPEQQSAALNHAGPENVGAGDALAEARGTIAEAVEIMRPFAESSANYDGYLAEEDCDNAGVLTVASLRAARAFVAAHSSPTNGDEQ